MKILSLIFIFYSLSLYSQNSFEIVLVNGETIEYNVDEIDKVIFEKLTSVKNEDYNNKQLLITNFFPNPSEDISTTLFNSEIEGLYSVNICDESGKEVFSKNNLIAKKGQNEFKWENVDDDGNRLSSGAYFIKISTGTSISIKKIIIER